MVGKQDKTYYIMAPSQITDDMKTQAATAYVQFMKTDAYKTVSYTHLTPPHPATQSVSNTNTPATRYLYHFFMVIPLPLCSHPVSPDLSADQILLFLHCP